MIISGVSDGFSSVVNSASGVLSYVVISGVSGGVSGIVFSGRLVVSLGQG